MLTNMFTRDLRPPSHLYWRAFTTIRADAERFSTRSRRDKMKIPLFGHFGQICGIEWSWELLGIHFYIEHTNNIRHSSASFCKKDSGSSWRNCCVRSKVLRLVCQVSFYRFIFERFPMVMVELTNWEWQQSNEDNTWEISTAWEISNIVYIQIKYKNIVSNQFNCGFWAS